MNVNLAVLLPGDDRYGQSRFLSLGGCGDRVKYVPLALLDLFPSGSRM